MVDLINDLSYKAYLAVCNALGNRSEHNITLRDWTGMDPTRKRVIMALNRQTLNGRTDKPDTDVTPW